MWECLATFLAPRCRPPPALRRGVKVTCLAQRKDGVTCHFDDDWGFQVSELEAARVCPHRARNVRALSAPGQQPKQSPRVPSVSKRPPSPQVCYDNNGCLLGANANDMVRELSSLACLRSRREHAHGRCRLPGASPEGCLTAARCAGAGRGSGAAERSP